MRRRLGYAQQEDETSDLGVLVGCLHKPGVHGRQKPELEVRGSLEAGGGVPRVSRTRCDGNSPHALPRARVVTAAASLRVLAG
jgi:hypothetical protein